MSAEPEHFKTAFRDLVAARQGSGEHPAPDTLIDYVEGTLDPSERDSLQDHLTLCPECSQTVIDLVSFPDVQPLDTTRSLTDRDTREALEALKPRLSEDEKTPLTRSPARLTRRFAGHRILGMAAALAVAFWAGTWQRTSSGPQGDFDIVHLISPQDAVQRNLVFEPPALAPRTGGFHIMVLDYYDPTRFESYRVAVLEDGEPVLAVIEVVKSSAGNFNLFLPGDLAEGRYELELRGSRNSQEELLRTYQFTVMSSP